MGGGVGLSRLCRGALFGGWRFLGFLRDGEVVEHRLQEGFAIGSGGAGRLGEGAVHAVAEFVALLQEAEGFVNDFAGGVLRLEWTLA